MRIHFSKNTFIFIILFIFLCLIYSPVLASDTYYEFGAGGGVNLRGVGSTRILVSPAVNMPFRGKDRIRLRIEGDLEYIEGGGEKSYIIGAAPVFRYSIMDKPSSPSLSPFVEFGVGINYTSRKIIDYRRLGAHYLFSPQLGVGVDIGRERANPMSLSLRYRHLSNAYTQKYNEGLDTLYFILSVGFR